MQRRPFLHTAAALALIAAAAVMPAQAQTFPAKPIKLVIAFPAGGPTDITMRSLADNAGKILGQPVIVENKPGAGGTLPAQQLQSAQADGYTLAQIPLGVFRLGYTTKINWDPVKDISYVINVTGYAFGIVVPADSPFKTWADFVAYAKANPGKLTYGSTGTLTSPHLTTELIAQKAGIELQHVPYKGSADLMLALVSGQLMAGADSTGFAPQVEAGKLRVLNTWGEKRWTNSRTRPR
jgi:tripartite-type tricarboxylate transporter receptor subunit TctC